MFGYKILCDICDWHIYLKFEVFLNSFIGSEQRGLSTASMKEVPYAHEQ